MGGADLREKAAARFDIMPSMLVRLILFLKLELIHVGSRYYLVFAV